MFFKILLCIHIAFGSLAILSTVTALSCKKGARLHRKAGSCFMLGMLGVFVTALPMALIIQDEFLFCITLFSAYISFSGWRYAVRRSLPAPFWERAISVMMILISLIMLSAAILTWKNGSYQPVVFSVFGLISFRFSLFDYLLYRKESYPRFERLQRHVAGMVGGTIAVFTAVLVTNFSIQPAWFLWLAPTIILIPFIIYWNRRIASGKM